MRGCYGVSTRYGSGFLSFRAIALSAPAQASADLARKARSAERARSRPAWCWTAAIDRFIRMAITRISFPC